MKRAMRTFFVGYLVFVAAGLTLWIVVGLTHH
jgi:hypothetical protein